MPDPKELNSPKDSFPQEEKPAVKKVADNLKEFAKKPNRSTECTSKEKFLKMLNAEKDPEKRRLIKAALRGRMFS